MILRWRIYALCGTRIFCGTRIAYGTRIACGTPLICAVGLFFAVGLVGCHAKLKRLPIENTVSISQGLSTQKMPGTNLYFHLPSGFTIDSAHSRIIKDNEASIYFVYSPGENLYDQVAQMEKSAEAKTGLYQHYYYDVHAFQLGGRQARIYYSPSDKPGDDRLLLIVNDNQFSVAAIADFPSDNAELKDSLLATLFSLSAGDPNPNDVSSIEPFTLDLSNTEFAYNNHAGLAFFYTIGAASNPDDLVGEDQFMVVATKPEQQENLQKKIKTLLQIYEHAQLKIQIYSAHPTYIRAYPAYELEGTIHFQGQEGKIYLLAMGNGVQSLFFSALLYKNISHRLNEVIYIAHSLQFKRALTN